MLNIPILHRIIHLGEEHIKSKADLFRLKVHNTLSFLAVCTYFVGVVIYFYTGVDSISLYISAVIGILSFSVVLFCHKKGRFQFSSLLSNGTIFFLISLLYFSMDAAIHIEIQFLFFSIFPLFLTYQNIRLAFYSFSIFILAFLWTTIYGVEVKTDISVEEIQVLNMFIHVVLAMFLVVVVIFSYQYDKLRISEIEEREKALEKSHHLKSAFLSNISHEIRTPMNSIIGFSELLKQGNITSKEQEEYFDIIYKNSAQLLKIVNDTLDLSKIETEEVKIVSEELDVHELLEDLERLFSNLASEKGLKLQCEYDAFKKLIIETDAQKVRQVMINLLDNALKFTAEGEVNFGYEIDEEKKYLSFFVRDTGLGIEKEQQPKIFDRFQQIQRNNGKVVTGTGLGLSISKSFAELLGGQLSLESNLGEGAIFNFSVPYKAVKERILQRAFSSNTIKRRCTILLAEDIYFNRILIEKLLDQAQVTLHSVENGDLAVKFVEKYPNKLDIVLMDIKMPVLSGQDAMIAIKKIYPDLPIIAFTAFSMNEEKTALLKDGFDGFISKPIEASALVKMINSFL